MQSSPRAASSPPPATYDEESGPSHARDSAVPSCVGASSSSPDQRDSTLRNKALFGCLASSGLALTVVLVAVGLGFRVYFVWLDAGFNVHPCCLAAVDESHSHCGDKKLKHFFQLQNLSRGDCDSLQTCFRLKVLNAVGETLTYILGICVAALALIEAILSVIRERKIRTVRSGLRIVVAVLACCTAVLLLIPTAVVYAAAMSTCPPFGVIHFRRN